MYSTVTAEAGQKIDISGVVLRDIEAYSEDLLSDGEFATQCALNAYDHDRSRIANTEALSEKEFVAEYLYRLEEFLAASRTYA